MTTEDIEKLDPQTKAELIEIYECLLDIRRRTGFGRIEIVLYKGEISDLDTTIKRKPKVEKKFYQ